MFWKACNKSSYLKAFGTFFSRLLNHKTKKEQKPELMNADWSLKHSVCKTFNFYVIYINAGDDGIWGWTTTISDWLYNMFGNHLDLWLAKP